MNEGLSLNKTDGDELLEKYLFILCDKESERTYRLKSDAGEGLMRDYVVTKGINLIYSEIESYYSFVSEQRMPVDYLEIMYMVEGHAEFEMENRRVASADKGDVCIFNSNVSTRNCLVGKGGMRCLSIVLMIEALESFLNHMFETNEFNRSNLFREAMDAKSCICVPAGEKLGNIFSQLMQLPERYGDHHRKILVTEAILFLLGIGERKNSDFRYFSGDTGNKVHAARKILGEDIASDISVEELSDRVGLNRTTLQRVFKQMYGVTTFEYRTQVRMQEAKNLLLNDSVSVTEAAGLCGYSNASKFAAAFKKVFGVTPSKWRNEM